MAHNARIDKALAELETQEKPNIAATAKRHGVARKTLSDRWHKKSGTIQDANSNVRQNFTDLQEDVLIEYINKLTDRGFPPTPQILKNIAESVVKRQLGVNWVARFCKRHRNRLVSVYLRTIDHKRKLADNSEHFQHFYDSFLEKLQKYDIDAKNIYNVDEKGFLIGLSRASQDGNREFITLIAAICADGTSLAPALIYVGESEHLQDTWLDDFDSTAHSAFFVCSKNGWSNDQLGLYWLQEVFDRLTKSKTSTQDRRLLLVDGHNSHVNMPFIDRHLEDEGKLDQNAKILLNASEQLATNLEISRHEVAGLRRTIIHEQKKRKCGKALKLLEEGENPSQARFFSPEKVARVRIQNEAIKQAEHQREQAKQDKKLQGAIARAEKARVAQEKKEARDLARQAAREQATREKQERLAIREARTAEKVAEAAKRKRDAEEKRAKRLQAKEAKEKGVSRRKRGIEANEVARPKKRLRSEPSPTRSAGASQDPSSLHDSVIVQSQPTKTSRKNLSSGAVRSQEEATAPSMRFARSGRAIQLPVRYKQ
ncbi:hypothetical protein DV736_g6558, partial [Chaetothyriales sp. CBS 134916]